MRPPWEKLENLSILKINAKPTAISAYTEPREMPLISNCGVTQDPHLPPVRLEGEQGNSFRVALITAAAYAWRGRNAPSPYIPRDQCSTSP